MNIEIVNQTIANFREELESQLEGIEDQLEDIEQRMINYKPGVG